MLQPMLLVEIGVFLACLFVYVQIRQLTANYRQQQQNTRKQQAELDAMSQSLGEVLSDLRQTLEHNQQQHQQRVQHLQQLLQEADNRAERLEKLLAEAQPSQSGTGGPVRRQTGPAATTARPGAASVPVPPEFETWFNTLQRPERHQVVGRLVKQGADYADIASRTGMEQDAIQLMLGSNRPSHG